MTAWRPAASGAGYLRRSRNRSVADVMEKRLIESCCEGLPVICLDQGAPVSPLGAQRERPIKVLRVLGHGIGRLSGRERKIRTTGHNMPVDSSTPAADSN